MLQGLRGHVRNNVVGYLALFVALSGTAYAATELEKNEVKSKHIGKGQVKNADLADFAVTSPKVANGSLLDEDFAPGQLPKGPQGERGLPGEQGQRGEQGIPGVSGYERVVTGTGATTSPDERTLSAQCPAGKQVLSGGGFVFGEGERSVDFDSFYPNDLDRTFVITAYEEEPTNFNWGLTVIAVCGVVQP